MMQSEIIQYLILVLFAIFIGGVSLLFIIENEKRASIQALKLLVVHLAVVGGHFLFHIPVLFYALVILLAVVIGIVLLLLKFPFRRIELKIDNEQVDERTTIFSRMFELKNESKKKTQFYSEFPKLKENDDRLRSLPGLLSPQSKFYDTYYFKLAGDYNLQLEKLFPLINGDKTTFRSAKTVGGLTRKIEEIAYLKGAHSVGYTELKSFHFYSKKGRGKNYNRPINSTHKYAVAITVEMNDEAVSYAPYAPVIAESCKQYLHAADIAISIAEFIRENGYDAKAHIDANYEVICPLVARDAGLGDIGRMGLLMTPKLGPRVRLAVITTTLPLVSLAITNNGSIQYFCRICKKCANACPSQAIQKEDVVKNGEVRYKINHERCYGLWAKFGTDCARCMSVCPYSHPNNWFHNIVRFGINRNPIFARIALLADDYFYGKVPKIKHYKNVD